MTHRFYPFPYPKAPEEKWPIVFAIALTIVLFFLLIQGEKRKNRDHPFADYVVSHSTSNPTPPKLDEYRLLSDTKNNLDP